MAAGWGRIRSHTDMHRSSLEQLSSCRLIKFPVPRVFDFNIVPVLKWETRRGVHDFEHRGKDESLPFRPRCPVRAEGRRATRPCKPAQVRDPEFRNSDASSSNGPGHHQYLVIGVSASAIAAQQVVFALALALLLIYNTLAFHKTAQLQTQKPSCRLENRYTNSARSSYYPTTCLRKPVVLKVNAGGCLAGIDDSTDEFDLVHFPSPLRAPFTHSPSQTCVNRQRFHLHCKHKSYSAAHLAFTFPSE